MIKVAAASVLALIMLTAATEQPSNGQIVIYRGSTLVGAPSACPIRHEGREIVELGRGKYSEWVVPAGRYILTNKTSSIEVSVDEGETRYVRCSMKMGMMAWRADLQISDKSSFEAIKSDLKFKLAGE